METKGTGRGPKNAVQTICDAIFKVVDYRLKELDNKWSKQLKKIDGGVVESAAPSKPNSILIVPFSIATNEWGQASDGMYVYEVPNEQVTRTMVLTGCNPLQDTAGNIVGPMCWETIPGKIVLSVLILPTGTVEGNLFFREMVA